MAESSQTQASQAQASQAQASQAEASLAMPPPKYLPIHAEEILNKALAEKKKTVVCVGNDVPEFFEFKGSEFKGFNYRIPAAVKLSIETLVILLANEVAIMNRFADDLEWDRDKERIEDTKSVFEDHKTNFEVTDKPHAVVLWADDDQAELLEDIKAAICEMGITSIAVQKYNCEGESDATAIVDTERLPSEPPTVVIDKVRVLDFAEYFLSDEDPPRAYERTRA